MPRAKWIFPNVLIRKFGRGMRFLPRWMTKGIDCTGKMRPYTRAPLPSTRLLSHLTNFHSSLLVFLWSKRHFLLSKSLLNFLLALYLVWSDRIFYTIILREEGGSRNQKEKMSIHIYQNNWTDKQPASQKIQSADKGVEQQKFSRTAGGGAKWHNYFGPMTQQSHF